jgi:hypothetical protein
VGGLAGVMNGNIVDSYATGNVTGRDAVGGLAGGGGTYLLLLRTFASGVVSGRDDTGGLVGKVDWTQILVSYSTSQVTGRDRVGGLLGSGTGNIADFNEPAIKGSYFAGTVSGNDYVGGLAGRLNLGYVLDSYAPAGGVTGVGPNVHPLLHSADYNEFVLQPGSAQVLTAQQMKSHIFLDNTSSDWKIYEGRTTPLLRVFMTPLVLPDTVVTYNGTTQTGAGTAMAHVYGTPATGRNASPTAYSPDLWSDQLGYDLSGGLLTINPAPLRVTANSFSKLVDGVPYIGGNGVTYNGFVNGESPTALSGVLSYGGTSQGALALGNYSIVPRGYGASAANYTISYVDGTLTIANPAPVENVGLLAPGAQGAIISARSSGTTGANVGSPQSLLSPISGLGGGGGGADAGNRQSLVGIDGVGINLPDGVQ